jgi:hypothetical protein
VTPHGGVAQVRGAVRTVIGGDCPTCPWRGFTDPVVVDVLDLDAVIGDGAPVTVTVDDPPHHLWQGLLEYRSHMQAARSFMMDKQRKEHDQRMRELEAKAKRETGGSHGGAGNRHTHPRRRGGRSR